MNTRRQFLQAGALLALLSVSAHAQLIGRRPVRNGGLASARSANTELATAGSSWTLLFPNTILDERFAASAVYDAPTNSMIVFGGANGIGTSSWTTVVPDGSAGSPSAATFTLRLYSRATSPALDLEKTAELCSASASPLRPDY